MMKPKYVLIGIIVLVLGITITVSTVGIVQFQTAMAASANSFAPGQVKKFFPTDPVSPGASSFSPGHTFRLHPGDPVSPGASSFSPGHLKNAEPPCNEDVCPSL